MGGFQGSRGQFDPIPLEAQHHSSRSALISVARSPMITSKYCIDIDFGVCTIRSFSFGAVRAESRVPGYMTHGVQGSRLQNIACPVHALARVVLMPTLV